MAWALVDGFESDRISIADRGLQYGDGLFETIAVLGGRPCQWRAHLRRLRRGAQRLAVPCPSGDLLEEELARVAGDQDKCVVKLILTRGTHGRGYRPPASVVPTRIVSRHPWPSYPEGWTEEGVVVRFCATTLAQSPRLAGLKHLNRLEQVLARAEWEDPDVAEGLMCDDRGNLISGTMSNLFLVQGRVLATPRLDTGGVAGTVRALVLEMAGGFGLEPVEQDLCPKDLEDAEGLFLTNALIGVWPVRRLGRRELDLARLPSSFLAAARKAAHTTDTGSKDACAYS